jgi:hypothetical protein
MLSLSREYIIFYLIRRACPAEQARLMPQNQSFLFGALGDRALPSKMRSGRLAGISKRESLQACALVAAYRKFR